MFYLYRRGETGNVKGADKHAGRILKMCLPNFFFFRQMLVLQQKLNKQRLNLIFFL